MLAKLTAAAASATTALPPSAVSTLRRRRRDGCDRGGVAAATVGTSNGEGEFVLMVSLSQR